MPPLTIEGGVESFTESSAIVCLRMFHTGTDKTAASFRIELDHIHPKTRKVFAWPERVCKKLETLSITRPEDTVARSLTSVEPNTDASEKEADRLDLTMIGMGQFGPQDMDVFGYLRPDQITGRVSDSVIHLSDAFPEEAAIHSDDTELNMGGVLLEAIVHIHRLPQAGTGYVIRSGLAGYTQMVRRVVHWGLDITTGKPLWTMEGVTGMMDLDARKLAPASESVAAALNQNVKPELKA